MEDSVIIKVLFSARTCFELDFLALAVEVPNPETATAGVGGRSELLLFTKDTQSTCRRQAGAIRVSR